MNIGKSQLNIFLSNPGFICGAGDSSDTAHFIKNITSGSREGIQKINCDLVGEEGVKSFYVGRISDEKLKPTGDKFDARVLQILDFSLSFIEPTVKKAIEKYGAKRIGICLGTCDNGSELSFLGHRDFFTKGAFPAGYELKTQGVDYPAVYARRKLGTGGITLAFSTACSSSASAIIKAKELIQSGICDAVIAGGIDVTGYAVLLGFDQLGAISHEMTNPFSKNRNGINVGEGACFFVLAKDDLDGTGIQLAGTGESSDANHMTAPLADGTGAKQAMESALKDAGLSPADIDYINLHGTGTHLNDSMEGKGVDLVFGDYKVAVSSTKPMTGHTLGAAGSLELAECFYAIQEQKLPVHVWDGIQDDEIPTLNIVTVKNANEINGKRTIKCCMSNSFAFGGCNASLVIKKA
ncbi:MAG: 3-oxoacyl-ACP synthase [Treponema sp.]|nr:3-oxoacyl-ACP synthase [Treponema sp.]